MDALVFSDSHGRTELLLKMLKDEDDCELCFFLGDGEKDLATVMTLFPKKKFIYVRGNCDPDGVLDGAEDVAYKTIEGTTIVATHGHRFFVKTTLHPLLDHAEGVMAKAVFYGHTHVPDFHYDSSFRLFVLNPGALCAGNYARIEINKHGIEADFRSVYD